MTGELAFGKSEIDWDNFENRKYDILFSGTYTAPARLESAINKMPAPIAETVAAPTGVPVEEVWTAAKDTEATRVVRSSATIPSTREPSPSQDKPKSKTWLWIVLAALLIAVVSAVVVNNNKKQKEERARIEYERIEYERIENERRENERRERERIENERMMEESCFNNCSSIADYQDYLNRYPNGRFAAQASSKIEQMKHASLENNVNAFIQQYTSLAEASDNQMIDRLVSQLFAPTIKRYFSAYDKDRSYVADSYKKYDDVFQVYGKHSNVRWNTVSFTESNGSIQLTYEEDYSIDRYDNTKYSIFVLEKHIELNSDFKIVSLYDVQLSKSKK